MARSSSLRGTANKIAAKTAQTCDFEGAFTPIAASGKGQIMQG
jgi:hypothetical protein